MVCACRRGDDDLSSRHRGTAGSSATACNGLHCVAAAALGQAAAHSFVGPFRSERFAGRWRFSRERSAKQRTSRKVLNGNDLGLDFETEFDRGAANTGVGFRSLAIAVRPYGSRPRNRPDCPLTGLWDSGYDTCRKVLPQKEFGQVVVVWVRPLGHTSGASAGRSAVGQDDDGARVSSEQEQRVVF